MIEIRKTAVNVEQVFHEGGPKATEPLVKASAIAVIKNPFAGQFVPEIADFMEQLKPLGLQLAGQLIEAPGGSDHVQGYGKGAICLLYTSPSPRDQRGSRMPSSA